MNQRTAAPRRKSPKKKHTLFYIFLFSLLAFIAVLFVVGYVLDFRYLKDDMTGTKFLGKVQNDLPYDGRIYYSNGAKARLIGENKKILYDNGDYYVGEISGLNQHGKGHWYQVTLGDEYIGDFVNNEKTGQGKWLYSNGDVYEGSVVDGAREGVGLYTWANGNSYWGEFTDNMRNGTGIYRINDGTVYIGSFADNLKAGSGALLFPNKDFYFGQFAADERSGRGVYIWSKSREYESEFDELFEVRYSREFIDGFLSYFTGDFLSFFTDDVKKAPSPTQNAFFQAFEAILLREFTEAYIGEFRSSQMDGRGIYYFSNSTNYSGTFQNGLIVKDTPADGTSAG